MSDTLKQRQVKTGKPTRPHATPRLPHERDESDDSQDQNEAQQPRDDIKQAYRDIKSGQVDTDAREIHGVDEVVNPVPVPTPDKVIKKR